MCLLHDGESLKPRLGFVHGSEDKVAVSVYTPQLRESTGKDWKAHHTFEEKTRIEYPGSGFFGAER